MKNLIFGLIIGFVLGTVITATWAAMSGSINDRRYNQYVETSTGQTALLITIAE